MQYPFVLLSKRFLIGLQEKQSCLILLKEYQFAVVFVFLDWRYIQASSYLSLLLNAREGLYKLLFAFMFELMQLELYEYLQLLEVLLGPKLIKFSSPFIFDCGFAVSWFKRIQMGTYPYYSTFTFFVSGSCYFFLTAPSNFLFLVLTFSVGYGQFLNAQPCWSLTFLVGFQNFSPRPFFFFSITYYYWLVFGCFDNLFWFKVRAFIIRYWLQNCNAFYMSILLLNY